MKGRTLWGKRSAIEMLGIKTLNNTGANLSPLNFRPQAKVSYMPLAILILHKSLKQDHKNQT